MTKRVDYEGLVVVMRTIQIGAIVGVAALVATLAVYLFWPSKPCDPDPWSCFGAGRYQAMAEGRVCECYAKKYL